MTTLSTDTFTRANQSGWGTASDSEVWTQARGVQTLAIASNEGTVVFVTNTNTNVMTLGTQTPGNCEVLARCSFGNTSDGFGCALHFIDSNDFYAAGMNFLSTNNFAIRKDKAGTFTTVANTSFTAAVNTFYWIRFNCTGSAGNWTLKAKIWQDGSGEPGPFTITGTDSSSTNDAGKYGLAGFAINGSTGLKFDSLTVTDASTGVTHLRIMDGYGGVFS